MTREQLGLLLDYIDLSLLAIEYKLGEGQDPYFMKMDADKIRIKLFEITGEQD